MDDRGEGLVIAADLLKKSFSRRNFSEKLEIVKLGRPTAALTQPAGQRICAHLHSSNYERYSWLTASSCDCNRYCWECLLFATDRCGVWSCHVKIVPGAIIVPVYVISC
jgi:hypothetical protein